MYDACCQGSDNYIGGEIRKTKSLKIHFYIKMHSTFTLIVLSSNIIKLPSAVPTKRKLLCLLKGKMSKIVTK